MSNGSRSKHYLLETILLVSLITLIVQQFVSYFEVLQNVLRTSEELTFALVTLILGIVVWLYVQHRKVMLTQRFLYMSVIFVTWMLIIDYFWNPPQARLDIIDNCNQSCPIYYSEFIVVNSGEITAREINIELVLDSTGVLSTNFGKNSYSTSSTFNPAGIESYDIAVFPEDKQHLISVVDRNNSDTIIYDHLSKWRWRNNTYLIKLNELAVGEIVKIRLYAPFDEDGISHLGVSELHDLGKLNIYPNYTIVQLYFDTSLDVMSRLQKDEYGKSILSLIANKIISEGFLHSGLFHVDARCNNCKNTSESVFALSIVSTLMYNGLTDVVINPDGTAIWKSTLQYYSPIPVVPVEWNMPVAVKITRYEIQYLKELTVLNDIVLHNWKWVALERKEKTINVFDADWEFERQYRFARDNDSSDQNVYVCFAEDVRDARSIDAFLQCGK